MLARLRELRAQYFQDLESLSEPEMSGGHATLTDTDAVEAEAATSSAAERVSPEIQEVVIDLYQRSLKQFEYVKEANDKFIAMLEEALDEDPSNAKTQTAIREFAESLLLDPVMQPLSYSAAEQDDIIDSAQGLTQQEAVLYGDASNTEDTR
ncbi:MAG: hypothetical protein H7Y37_20210 [Anaerolineae bacterium]|nr:hypothetical protein [Gloeobacterales cyanobacterium ES-bin-313]